MLLSVTPPHCGNWWKFVKVMHQSVTPSTAVVTGEKVENYREKPVAVENASECTLESIS